MPYERLRIAQMGIAHSLSHSLLLALPPILPLIVAETGFTYGLIGFTATAAYLAYGLGAIAGGPISDFLGSPRAVAVSLIAPGLGSILIALQPSFTGLALGLLVIGAFGSLYHPAVNSLISKAYDKRIVARVMGLHGAGGNIGQVVTPFASIAIATALGWRYSLLAFGVPAMATGFSFLIYGGGRAPTGSSKFRIALRKALSRGFAILMAYSVLQSLYYRGVELYAPSFLNEVKGLPVEVAGAIASITMAFGVLGQYVGGRLATKTERVVLLLAALASLLGLTSIQLLEGYWAAAAFAVAYGVGFYMAQPAQNAFIARSTPVEVRGAAYGLFYTLIFTSGSASSMVASLTIEHLGLSYAFVPLTVVAPIAAMVALLIPKRA